MAKTRKQITIDTSLAERVDKRDEFNLSGFVNACLEHHFREGGSVGSSAKRAELEHLEDLINDIESHKQKFVERRDELEEQIEGQDTDPDRLAEVLDKLKDIPPRKRTPDNPAIQQQSMNLELTPEQLLKRLNDKHPPESVPGSMEVA